MNAKTNSRHSSNNKTTPMQTTPRVVNLVHYYLCHQEAPSGRHCNL